MIFTYETAVVTEVDRVARILSARTVAYDMPRVFERLRQTTGFTVKPALKKDAHTSKSSFELTENVTTKNNTHTRKHTKFTTDKI
jgi:hypothetical protein